MRQALIGINNEIPSDGGATRKTIRMEGPDDIVNFLAPADGDNVKLNKMGRHWVYSDYLYLDIQFPPPQPTTPEVPPIGGGGLQHTYTILHVINYSSRHVVIKTR